MSIEPQAQQPQVLYAAVVTLPRTIGEVVSVAFAHPAGRWFYAEVVDLPLENYSQHEKDEICSKLRCVAGTTFVTRETLGQHMCEWLAAMGQGAHQVLRVETHFAHRVLSPILERGCAATGKSVQVDWSICRFSNATLNEFYAKSGSSRRDRGQRKGSHSLIDALGIAFCDLDRTIPMDLADVRHLEMVMGSKGAMGYRAWGRRHEAANRRLVAAATA